MSGGPTNNDSGEPRFPSITHILDQVKQGDSALLTIPGIPECRIAIEPELTQIQVRVRDDQSELSLGGYKALSSFLGRDETGEWNVLCAEWAHTPVEVYQFACDVIDRIQQLDESLQTAVDVSLAGIRSILRQESLLSREDQIGLFGELFVFLTLLEENEFKVVLSSWRGPDKEEHDFALSTMDLEVKTTQSEDRKHWITSATQLSPIQDRPLSLVSIQLTPKEGEATRTLSELVQALIDASEGYSAEFIEKLNLMGYYVQHADLYITRWSLRSPVEQFLVDDNFPRLTVEQLASVADLGGRIVDVKYQIDLTGMPTQQRFSAIRL